ncbi:MAG: hypothetical protein KAX49_09610 [Halanaerobiales bacterium]|nr:hypothetical protein [Halanaerobiales bacterium]
MVINDIRPICAFFKKELLFLLRYPIQITCELIIPIFNILPSVLLALALTQKNGLEHFAEQSGTENFVAFIFIGIVFYYFNDIQEQTGYMLQKEMWFGTLEQVWFAPVNKIFVIFGWILFAMVKAIIYTIIGMLAIRLFGFKIAAHITYVHIPISIADLLNHISN